MNKKYLIIIAILLLGWMVSIAFFVFKLKDDPEPTTQVTTFKKLVEQDTPSNDLPESTDVGNVIDYPVEQWTKQYCNRETYKISITSFPLKFSQKIINKYGYEFDCAFAYMQPQTEESLFAGSFLNASYRINGEGQEGGNLIIFDDSSIYKAFGPDLITQIKREEPILELTNNLYIQADIMQPGPYGLSSSGIWLSLYAYKKVGTLTILVTKNLEIPVKDDVLQLFLKYADKNTFSEEIEGQPKYTANEKYDEFKKEFIETHIKTYPNNSEPYKGEIDALIQDLSEISR